MFVFILVHFVIKERNDKGDRNKQIKVNVFIHAEAMPFWRRGMKARPLSHLCSDNVEASRLHVSHLVYFYGLLPAS